MMKIQTLEIDGRLILQVEGRLTGAFVDELDRCWKAARARRPQISVDLKNVTCVDRAGRYLLRAMHGDGVTFLRAGLTTQDVLEEIAQEQECGKPAR